MNKKNISRRHHYIPQTYLKGFCNQNKKFYIFDKNKQKIKGKEFSTKTHFFEMDRNIMNINGVENDEIEALYNKQDDDIAEILQKITESKSIENVLGLKGHITLKYFLANLFWRMPSNDRLADSFYDQIKYTDLPFSIKGLNIKDEIKLKEQHIKDENFRKLAKVLVLPLMTFSFIDDPHFIDKWNFIYTPQKANWDKRLTCDNPIIFQRVDDLFNFKNNIMFPLTGNKILFCLEDLDWNQKIDPSISKYIDIAVFSNAFQYVCSSDKVYLEEISELYYGIQKNYKNNSHKYIIEKTFSLFKRKSKVNI